MRKEGNDLPQVECTHLTGACLSWIGWALPTTNAGDALKRWAMPNGPKLIFPAIELAIGTFRCLCFWAYRL